MNNLQKICSDICGYTPMDAQGARNDFYYECKTGREKIDFVKDFSLTAEKVNPISEKEALAIVEFLDFSSGHGDESYWKFKNLGEI